MAQIGDLHGKFPAVFSRLIAVEGKECVRYPWYGMRRWRETGKGKDGQWNPQDEY